MPLDAGHRSAGVGGKLALCRAATRRSPSLVNATTLGVVRSPSALVMTTGLPPSTTATQLFVVPRSIPITLLILVVLSVFATRIFFLQYHIGSV